jgi:hypothetical protein
MYRTHPVSAITDVFTVDYIEPFDPWTSWHGFWADLEPIGSVGRIRFRDMKADPVIGEWSAVRRSFQGIITQQVPFAVYNRLLEMLGEKKRTELGLEMAEVASIPESGSFENERDFEEQVVEPVLKGLGLKFKRQESCRFQCGQKTSVGRVDHLVLRNGEPLTVIENKFKILNEDDLESARVQAESYALQLRLPSFVVAAPEGWWVYAVEKYDTRLVLELPGNTVQTRGPELREVLESLL